MDKEANKMNFMTDQDGFTKKDFAFLTVMILGSIFFVGLLFIIMIDYFNHGFTEINIQLTQLLFDAIYKLMIIVITYFYGTSMAITLLTGGKFKLPLVKSEKVSDEPPKDE